MPFRQACEMALSQRDNGLCVLNQSTTFAAYYAKKRAEGKEHRVALTHVAKKLLRVIYTLQTVKIRFLVHW